MPDTETIGAAILRTRTERGQTQGEAAELMGASQNAVSRWEAGGAVPATHKRAGVARYLGWSLTRVVDACLASVEAAREDADRAQVSALGIEAGQPVTLRNCWTCGWDDKNAAGFHVCFAEQPGDTFDWQDEQVWSPRCMPEEDADGCPGWKAKDEPTVPEVVATLDEMQAQAIRATGNVGWRGHLPICRGPGHTTAMRLRRAGLPVRKVRR